LKQSQSNYDKHPWGSHEDYKYHHAIASTFINCNYYKLGIIFSPFISIF